MDFSNIPLIAVMKSKMGYMSERQSELAQNIANVDTPGYRAMDVAEPDFSKMVAQKLQMAVTNGKHMSGMKGGSGGFKHIPRHNTDELNPMGNNVVIEEEMSKVAFNQAEYQKVLNLYSKAIGMFKIALGRPSGS
jgi:flagellar basal-body rod protein FlgB